MYHGTTPKQAQAFLADGIDGHLLHPRLIHGPQDSVPGLFVTPVLAVARFFGLCVIEIEVEETDLAVPPLFASIGVTLAESLANVKEPQALLCKRVQPASIKIVECHPDGYPFNPYDLYAETFHDSRGPLANAD